jgi:hypothetical protein
LDQSSPNGVPDPSILEKGPAMMHRFALGASVAIALFACSAFAEEKALKSGLQVGDSPTPFNPLHCNGRQAGAKSCLV